MKRLFLLLLTAITVQLNAQDLAHYKKVVKELSSAKYQGRGYAEDGANKAGKYLAKEFARAGVDEVICQPFKLDINTFPGKMDVAIDGKKLIPGEDFTLREFAPGIKGEYKLYYIDTLNYDAQKIFADLALPENEGAFVVCDFMFTYKHSADFKRLQSKSEWFRGACTGVVNPTNEQVEQALRTTQYGKCVYQCDNDVVDRQTVNMLFEDGITVTFSMNAFNKGGRHIHIFGTKGELWGSMDSREEPVRVRDFYTNQITEYPVTGKDGLESGHGGGDRGIVEALHGYICGTYKGFSASDVRVSVDNHHLVFAAEKSRLEGTVVTLEDYIAQL